MTGEAIFIFAMATILMHIKPGPGQALRIATVLKDGFAPAIAISFGVALICNIYLILAATGAGIISDLFQNSGIFFRIATAFYLIYLGYKGLNKKENIQNAPQQIKEKKLGKYFIMGCILSLSNPIDIFFFMGILPGLLEMDSLSPQNIVTFMALFTLITISIDILILGLTAMTKESITNSQYAQIITKVASIGLILIGLFLLYTAFVNNDFSYSLL